MGAVYPEGKGEREGDGMEMKKMLVEGGGVEITFLGILSV